MLTITDPSNLDFDVYCLSDPEQSLEGFNSNFLFVQKLFTNKIDNINVYLTI